MQIVTKITVAKYNLVTFLLFFLSSVFTTLGKKTTQKITQKNKTSENNN